jgi:hypothetical protein
MKREKHSQSHTIPILGNATARTSNLANCETEISCLANVTLNQHWARRRSLGDTQRQAGKLLSGPCLGAKTKVMSFNRAQSRTVIGLLTGHNTLRRHIYLLGQQDGALCRKCGVMEETTAHILCECKALASLRYA